MMQKATLILLLFLPFVGKSQISYDARQADDFRVKLNEFKYSLYPDLIKMKPESINDLFVTNDTLIAIYNKCKQFYIQNAKAKLEYQKAELAKYANTTVDLSYFLEDTTVNKDTLNFSLSVAPLLFKYLAYNPIELSSNLVQIVIAQTQSVSEMSATTLINMIAQPRTATKKINRNSYEIIIDRYKSAFVFHYQMDNQELTLIKVLKRKD